VTGSLAVAGAGHLPDQARLAVALDRGQAPPLRATTSLGRFCAGFLDAFLDEQAGPAGEEPRPCPPGPPFRPRTSVLPDRTVERSLHGSSRPSEHDWHAPGWSRARPTSRWRSERRTR